MPKVRHLITDFTGGEVSPRVSTRADLSRYDSACHEIENWIVAQQGGALFRRGSEYMGPSQADGDSTTPDVTLIEWRGGAGDEPDILFEIVNNQIRGWTKDGLILKGGVPYAVNIPGIGLSDYGAEVQYAQRGTLLVIANRGSPPIQIEVTATDNWSISYLPQAYFPIRRFTDAVAAPTESGDFELNFLTFSPGDPFRLSFPAPPGTLTSVSSGSPRDDVERWNERTTGDISFSTDPVEMVRRITDAIARRLIPEDFAVTHIVGDQYRLTFSRVAAGSSVSGRTVGSTAAGRIVIGTTEPGTASLERAWSYPTVVTYDGTYYRCIAPHFSVALDTPDTEPTLWTALSGAPAWELIQPSLAWNGTNIPYAPGGRGFPAAVAFHEQRLILAGTEFAPYTIWASGIQDFENFAPGVETDQPWSVDLDANESPYIRWMASQNGLWCGTSSGLWRLTANVTLSPTDIQADRFTSDRADRRMPRVVGNEVFYIPQGRQQLRTIRFQSETGPYETIELSALAEHLGRCRIRRIVYCQQPQPVVYLLVNTPGRVVAITYNRQGDLLAFSRLEFDGIIQDIASTTDPDDGDVLWLAIRRGDRVSIERLQYPVTITPCSVLTLTSTKHLDGWVTRSAVAGEVSGLDHLLGREVTVLNENGTFQKNATVALGSALVEAPVVVPNGDFASALTNWNIVSGSVINDAGQAKLEASSILGAAWLQSNVIPVTPGRRYRVRCQYRNNVPGANSQIPLLILIRNGDGSEVQLIYEEVADSATLTTAEASFVAVSTAADMAIIARLSETSVSTKSMWVDNYEVFEETSVQASVVEATGDNLIIGQPFTGRLRTMEPVVGNPSGPSMGNKKRWGDLTVRIYESSMPLVNGQRPSDYDQSDPRGTPHLLRSGSYTVNALGNEDGAPVVEQDLPYQTQVVGLYGDLSTGTGG